MLATFTPKFRNVEIRKVVDAAVEPQAKRYRLVKFDNPLFASPEARAVEIAKLDGYSDSMRNAVLHGEWMDADSLVHEFIPERHGGAPEEYHPSWRHIAVADPATESKLGLTVWAEDPTWVHLPTGTRSGTPDLDAAGRPQAGWTRTWWCVRAEYIAGIYTPTKIVKAVEDRLAGLNVVERIADSHEAWFIHQAADAGVTWRPVEGKTAPGRKDTMIRNLQERMGSRLRIADWCTALVDELQSYERAPETGRIVKASRFHLIDTAHYFAWHLPEPTLDYQYATWMDRVYHAHLLRERREQQERDLCKSAGARIMHRVEAPSGIEAPLPPMPRRAPRSPWRRQWRLT